MRIVWTVVVGVLVGCGGAPGTIEGTLGGKAVTVRQALFRSPTTPGMLVVFLSDDDQLCEHLKARVEQGAGLFFNLRAAAGPITTGSYAVLDDQKARAGINQNLGPLTAMTWAASAGKAGTVKLDALTDTATGHATGSFDVEYQNGDKVTGSFSATPCVLP